MDQEQNFVDYESLFNDVQLPQNWYKIPIGIHPFLALNSSLDKGNNLYVNVKEQICSIAPIFHLSAVKHVLVRTQTDKFRRVECWA